MQKYKKLESLIEPVFTLEGNLDIFFYDKQISLSLHTSFFPGSANLNPSEIERIEEKIIITY